MKYYIYLYKFNYDMHNDSTIFTSVSFFSVMEKWPSENQAQYFIIKQNILDDSKLVYFAADEQTKIDWPQIPCNIVDVASKPYFEVLSVTIRAC